GGSQRSEPADRLYVLPRDRHRGNVPEPVPDGLLAIGAERPAQKVETPGRMPHLRQVIAENSLVEVAEAVPEQKPAVRRGRVMSQDRQQRAELLIAHLAAAVVGFGVRVR